MDGVFRVTKWQDCHFAQRAALPGGRGPGTARVNQTSRFPSLYRVHNEKTQKKADPKTDPFKFGAGNETRTRDPDLGKVVLYQLSYSRSGVP